MKISQRKREQLPKAAVQQKYTKSDARSKRAPKPAHSPLQETTKHPEEALGLWVSTSSRKLVTNRMAKEDIKQIFFDDIRAKKSAGRGSYHKKSGSRSKRVPCSTDYMTQKEWKKLNGEVKTYDLSAPMSWPTFCSMPDDLKDRYIRYLFSHFGATKQALCEVFGTNIKTFNEQTKGCNFSDIFTIGRRITKQGKQELQNFFGADLPAIDTMTGQMETETVAKLETYPAAFRMEQLVLSFSGPFDADHIANSLRHFLPAGQSVAIQIRCDMRGEEIG